MAGRTWYGALGAWLGARVEQGQAAAEAWLYRRTTGRQRRTYRRQRCHDCGKELAFTRAGRPWRHRCAGGRVVSPARRVSDTTDISDSSGRLR